MHKKVFYKQEKRNIYLFATRRGGSSIISQILSIEPLTREIDQPFDQFRDDSIGDIKRKELPKKNLSQFIDLSKKERRIVSKYIKKITSGGHFYISPYEKANRTVLKIVNAGAIADFISEINNPLIVKLFRHPVPQALSIMRNNWGITVEPYLKSQKVEYFLGKEVIKKSIEILNEGIYFKKAILNWCYENIFLLRFTEVEAKSVYYENFVLNTEKEISSLFNYVHIDMVSDAIAVFEKPSRSSNFSDESMRNAIKNKDKNEILTAWEKKISDKEKEIVQEILNLFNITEYSAYSSLPVVRKQK